VSPSQSLSIASPHTSGPVTHGQPVIGACAHAPAVQASLVQRSASSQSPSTVQGTQPEIGVLAQLPAVHTSVVQALWSSQSAGVAHPGQPGSGVCVQPSVASQASSVQGSPSSQVGGVPGWQPVAWPHVSAPLQNMPSS